MKNAMLCLGVLPYIILAQKQGNIWYFGDKAGVNFNNNPPTALVNGQTDIVSPIGWNEASSAISDSSGTLLFYSNGVLIWNKQHIVMPNGSGLLGHRSSSMGCLIVPRPGSQRYFYVFTVDATENNFQNGLRYSVVDMCLDNGNGDVVTGSKNIPIYALTSERLRAVRHSNGSDYWILSHTYNTNEFHAFQLAQSGITSTVTSTCGPVDGGFGAVEMTISNNCQRIAFCVTTGVSSVTTSFLADFNNNTGVVSNAQILSTGGREYAAAFSPDDSKVYFSLTGVGSLFQYDLNAATTASIIASKNFLFQNQPDQYRHMAQGPDGRIYVSRAGSAHLSVINNPNSLYPGCVFVDTAIYLGGKITSNGLPNFITAFQYDNTVVPSCVVGMACVYEVAEQNAIFPNPNSGTFRLEFANHFNDGRFDLINSIGHTVHEQLIKRGTNEIQISALPAGLYTYLIVLENRPWRVGKLVIK